MVPSAQVAYSMNSVYLVDSGIACALGSGTDDVWPRLCRGESAVGEVRAFPTDSLAFHHAACIPGIDIGAEPNRVCALARRAFAQLGRVPDDTFVIWAGVKGNAEYVDALTSGAPTPVMHLPRHYRDWTCHALGIHGRGMEINAACASSSAALAVGAGMIVEGECSSALICAADVVSRFTFTGFGSLRALSPTTCRPFDVDRDGLCLGEGAVAMLLTSPAVAAECGYAPMAKLTGWGIANDANHITGPARDGSGLAAAIRGALDQAGLSPEQIEAWCAHGTGTVYNDAMELAALADVFGERRFPLFSIKGAIGHTLGAAGAMETAVAVKAMQEKMVPPTACLQMPEEAARGRVAREPQSFQGANILTSNSGFGGVNVALILEAPGDD